VGFVIFMITYVLFINAPLSAQAHYHAWAFANAVLDGGHSLRGVFFFGDAAAVANKFRDAPSDEFDPQRAWQALESQHDIELIVCSSSAQREGVSEQAQHTLATGFQIAGLGSFIELTLQADRVVQFGASR
jgi:tRNA 2-thiouridine synthesizing protein D